MNENSGDYGVILPIVRAVNERANKEIKEYNRKLSLSKKYIINGLIVSIILFIIMIFNEVVWAGFILLIVIVICLLNLFLGDYKDMYGDYHSIDQIVSDDDFTLLSQLSPPSKKRVSDLLEKNEAIYYRDLSKLLLHLRAITENEKKAIGKQDKLDILNRADFEDVNDNIDEQIK